MNKINKAQSQKMVGQYHLLKLIGKGGMGEIFLAQDSICKRQVALKKILPKLAKYPTIKKRFITEARIASQLFHPSIIPVYSLHIEEEDMYYTMPYIEGETLKSLLKKNRKNEEAIGPHSPPFTSISQFIHIFLKVCEGTEYAHLNGFLHHDLKPENIMIGKFGEVMILDWGIAHQIGEENTTDKKLPVPFQIENCAQITKALGNKKIVGTIGYMAPERAVGYPSNITTDIYSLGILLYQLLTLHLPFTRSSLVDFRRHMHHENWVEPQEIAPHRDIPPTLSHIAIRCLSTNPNQRYLSIRDMITDLQHYTEGRPTWIPTSELFVHRPKDWGFQENIFLAKHMAFSQLSGEMEWVVVMISKKSYSGSTRISANLTLSSKSHGIGFLMCVPNTKEEHGLSMGYVIWLSSKNYGSSTLLRSNVKIADIPEATLEPNRPYQIDIEKIENHLSLSLNGLPIFNYVSQMPFIGGHVGILSRDANYGLEKINISLGSHNVMVNCLAVPDAFLSNGNYSKAISEYRRIASSFPGRPEARKALFRSGLTFLQQAKQQKTKQKKSKLCSRAHNEFEKLHGSSGAPLEYLGKALVYQLEEDIEEELKCLELIMHKYPKHPLRLQIKKHVHFRLHEAARYNRRGTYAFLLLSINHLPEILNIDDTDNLINTLISTWQPLPFIQTPHAFSPNYTKYDHIALQLAFYLSKPTILYEMMQQLLPKLPKTSPLLINILLTLLEMDSLKLIDFILNKLNKNNSNPQLLLLKRSLKIITESQKQPLTTRLDLFFQGASKKLSSIESHALCYLFHKGLTSTQAHTLIPYFEKLKKPIFTPLHLWALLLAEDKKKADTLINSIIQTHLLSPSSPYHFLYRCYLTEQGRKTKTEHFIPSVDTCYPSSSNLLNHYLKWNIHLKKLWHKNAFSSEKMTLYRHLSLHLLCSGKKQRVLYFEKKVEKEKNLAQTAPDFL